MLASANGHLEVAARLIAARADIDATAPSTGESALTAASRNGQTAVVKALISMGADVEATTQEGQTALSIAKANGYGEIASMLTINGSKGPAPSSALRDSRVKLSL